MRNWIGATRRRAELMMRYNTVEFLESRKYLTAQLVKDINTNRIGADFQPAYYAAAGSVAYFTDHDGVNGDELWKTDGTAANTTMVKDINPGLAGSYPAYFMTISGITYFNATDANGSELWRTDGTSAGTYLVKDINPGSADSNPSDLTAYNGLLYFFANDGTHGRELWRSDGTASGTVLVDDTDPGSAGQNNPATGFQRIVVTTTGTMFFVAYNGTNTNLYTTTGAVGNETLLKTVIVTAAPGLLAATSGTLIYFQDSTTGYLYQSDGTVAGTVVEDTADTSAKNLMVAGSFLYFQNTTTVKSLGNGTIRSYTGSISSPTLIGVSGNNAYFTATNTSNSHPTLLYANAMLAGPVYVQDNVTAVSGTNVNGTFYFVAGSSSAGYSLWSTTGTSGTMIAILNPGGSDAVPGMLTAFGSKLLFNNSDVTNGLQPWISDGTTAGTALLKAIYTGTAPSSPVLYGTLNNKLLFDANDGGTDGYQLWASDGTSAGTTVLTDIYPGNTSSHFVNPLFVGNQTYFTAYDPTDGYALWVTDGTVSGTRMLVAPNPSGSIAPIALGSVNGWVLFSANDPTHGTELWRTDGTPGNTQLLSDIYTGSSSSSPSNGVTMNGYFYFAATDSTHGTELWRTDGTTAALVDDIFPGTSSSQPINFFVYNNTLLFSAESTTSTGAELWKSDGTTAGTALVKDIYTGSSSSSPRMFTLYNGEVYFAASDGTATNAVWVTDGTTAGTTLVDNDSAVAFAVASGTLFYMANTSTTPDQLFVSNGTPATTKEIVTPGAYTGSAALTVVDGRVFYIAYGSYAGDYELYSSDGTVAGTGIVQDLFPGEISGASGKIVGLNGNVYVAGDNSVSGRELYSFPDIYAPEVYAASANAVSNTISFSFSEDISSHLSASSLQLQDLTTSQTIAVSATGYSYNSSTNTATFTLPAAALVDGRYRATIPASLLTDTAGNTSSTAANLEFLSVSGSTANDSIIVQPSTDATSLQVYKNGSLTFTTPVASLGSLVVTGNAGNDSLLLTLGSTLLPGGYSFDGGSGTNTLDVVGLAGNHTVSLSPAGVQFEATPIAATNTQPIQFDPAGGSDGLTDSTVAGFPSALGSGRTISSLNLTGTLDINNNSVDLPSASLSTITALVQSGFNSGNWAGTGINSSAAAANPAHLMALGVIQNNQGGTALFSSSKLFDGTSPGAGDVLVKYTYYGDTDLSGKIDASDYSRIDSAFINHALTGWFNGDFNYDGVVNGSDYTLIDNAFNTQGATLNATLALRAVAVHPATVMAVPIANAASVVTDEWFKKRLKHFFD